jgi:hypothetical protein
MISPFAFSLPPFSDGRERRCPRGMSGREKESEWYKMQVKNRRNEKMERSSHSLSRKNSFKAFFHKTKSPRPQIKGTEAESPRFHSDFSLIPPKSGSPDNGGQARTKILKR